MNRTFTFTDVLYWSTVPPTAALGYAIGQTMFILLVAATGSYQHFDSIFYQYQFRLVFDLLAGALAVVLVAFMPIKLCRKPRTAVAALFVTTASFLVGAIGSYHTGIFGLCVVVAGAIFAATGLFATEQCRNNVS